MPGAMPGLSKFIFEVHMMLKNMWKSPFGTLPLLLFLACGSGGGDAASQTDQASSTNPPSTSQSKSSKPAKKGDPKRPLTDEEIVAEIKRLNPYYPKLKGAEPPTFSDADLERIRDQYGSNDYREKEPFALKKTIDNWLSFRESMRGKDEIGLGSGQWPGQVQDGFAQLGGGKEPPGKTDTLAGVINAMYWAVGKEIADIEDEIMTRVYRQSLAKIRGGDHSGSNDVIFLRDRYGAEEPRILMIRTAYNAVVNAGSEQKRDQARPWIEAFLDMPLKNEREQVENRLGMMAYRIKVPEGLIHVGDDLEIDYFIRASSEQDSAVAPSISVKAQIYMDQTLEDARSSAEDNGASILEGEKHGKGFILFSEFPTHGVVQGVLSQRTGNRRVEVRVDWKELPEDLRPKAHAYLERILKSFKFEN